MKRQDVDAFLDSFSKEALNETVNISLKNEYVLFAVPKSGTTALRRTLQPLEFEGLAQLPKVGPHPASHKSPFVKPFQTGRKKLKEILADTSMRKIAFVRNPFARTLSSYLDKILNSKPPYSAFYRRNLGLPADSTPSFDTFIEIISKQPEQNMEKHWAPQARQSFAQIMKLDFVGKIERFETDRQRLLDYLGLPFDRRRGGGRSHATGSSEKLLKFYTKATAGLVREKFDEDFTLFEYDPRPKWLEELP